MKKRIILLTTSYTRMKAVFVIAFVTAYTLPVSGQKEAALTDDTNVSLTLVVDMESSRILNTDIEAAVTPQEIKTWGLEAMNNTNTRNYPGSLSAYSELNGSGA